MHRGQAIRLAFGRKGLAWRSVQTPMVMPKADHVELTGGYRRVPVLQVGADIYCDTHCIARVLDRVAPSPPLVPPGLATQVHAVSRWAETTFLMAILAFFGIGGVFPEDFVEDRRKTMVPPGQDIDREAFSKTFSVGGIPIEQTKFWQSLPLETRWEASRRTAAFMLSNFLHGEQGALMVAAQLVNAVPHMDGKFYAATQTMDEARHVEVFAAYIDKLDEVVPIAPGLKKLLDGVLAAPDWMKKAVGMQIVTEGLALYAFRDMRNATQEPLLKNLLT